MKLMCRRSSWGKCLTRKARQGRIEAGPVSTACCNTGGRPGKPSDRHNSLHLLPLYHVEEEIVARALLERYSEHTCSKLICSENDDKKWYMVLTQHEVGMFLGKYLFLYANQMTSFLLSFVTNFPFWHHHCKMQTALVLVSSIVLRQRL